VDGSKMKVGDTVRWNGKTVGDEEMSYGIDTTMVGTVDATFLQGFYNIAVSFDDEDFPMETFNEEELEIVE
jgi:hypothetical protein